MPNPATDYQLPQTQDEIEELAIKIVQATPGLTYHQAYIRAVRLLGLVE